MYRLPKNGTAQRLLQCNVDQEDQLPIRVRLNARWATGAVRTSGSYTSGPPKALLHATITPSSTLPGYQGQSMAPHETLLWNRTTKRLSAVTHKYFDNYARALANKSGGVETNKDTVLQWELAGYLAESTPRGEFDILTAPNVYWEQVADLIGPIVRSWNVRENFSRSYLGKRNVRMSGDEWDGFSGFCTHADCPENTHWDLPVPVAAREILRSKIWPKVIVVPPSKEELMRIIQVTGKNPQYVSTGAHLTWLVDGKAKANALKVFPGLNADPVEVPNLTGLGLLVGPKPPA